jgi:hypothetical protein
MPRSSRAVLIAAVALIGTVGAMSLASASSGQTATSDKDRKTKTIHVIQTNEAVFTNIDVGATGDSPGDYVVITGPLVRPATSQRVGSVNAVCTLMQVTDEFPSQCVATASFRQGDITAQGVFLSVPGAPNVLAVTGGTGAYKTAHGTVTATILEDGATDLVFRLIL